MQRLQVLIQAMVRLEKMYTRTSRANHAAGPIVIVVSHHASPAYRPSRSASVPGRQLDRAKLRGPVT